MWFNVEHKVKRQKKKPMEDVASYEDGRRTKQKKSNGNEQDLRPRRQKIAEFI